MKHSLRLRAATALVCGGLLLGLHPAQAQQDEPYFQAYWAKQQPARTLKKASTKTAQRLAFDPTRNGPCDLIFNGDFEAQVQAPDRINNIGGGFPGTADNPVASQLQNWVSPTAGTPDFYASNATNPQANTATAVYAGANGVSPFGGIGCVGFFSRQSYVDANGNWRDQVSEYISAPMALAAGRYYAQFQANVSSNANAACQGIARGFGFQVSNGALPGGGTGTRDFITPSGRGLLNTSPLTQMDQWTRVSGIFDVAAGDNTITLGMFDPNPNSLVPLPGRNAATPTTYVFVDNLEIFRIPTAGPNKPCSTTSVQIGEGCDIPGASYAWYANGSGTPFSNTLTTSVSPTTATDYTLVVTLPDGSTHTTQTRVDACAPPPYGVTLGANTVGANECGPRVITAAVVGGSGNYSYFWNSNPSSGGSFTNTSTITVSPSSTTTFSVFVYDNGTGQAVQSSIIVQPTISGPFSTFIPNAFTPDGDGRNDRWEVRDANRGFGPINAFSYELNIFNRWGLHLVHSTNTITAVGSRGYNGGDIYWDGAGCSDGTYYYELKLTNCSQQQTIKGWVEIIGSNNFSAGSEVALKGLEVYPNPANEQLKVAPSALTGTGDAIRTSDAARASTITTATYAEYRVTLLDKTGRVRYSGTVKDKEVNIDTQKLPAGIYFLRLVGKDGKVVNKQIVVDHSR